MFPLFLLLLLLLAASPPFSDSASGPHIADLTVLLPPRMTNPVEYRLKGSDGCFSWSWDHHDILSVQPEYNDTGRCSTSARLVSIAPYSGRKETAVYATDLQSGSIIRCEVFIDNISKIRIFHHSVKLDLDGLAPLQIRAFDDEENVFSSLVGLQFMWKLFPKPSDADGAVHHLVHIPLKDTPLSDCGGFCGDLSTQIKLEDRGVGSDLYVVRGVEIGQEIVAACMLEPQFEHVKDEIVLTVAEAMSLDPPSPVFAIIGATVRYVLRVIRQSTPQVVELPSLYHRWSVLNSSVVQVDTTKGLAHALNFGVTSVIVEDTRVAGHLQTSSIHVVRPNKLCLYLVPVDSSYVPVDGSTSSISTSLWYVVAGLQYVIHIKAFVKRPEMQEIYLTKSNDIRLQYNHSAYWNTFAVPDEANVKHRWRVARLMKPISQGLGSLTAELAYRDAGNLEVLKVVQQVMVCNPVAIVDDSYRSLQRMHLPWVPDIYQDVKLMATGGCAKTSHDYNWLSSDMTIVSVSASGIIHAKRSGKAIIKALSVFDPLNYDELVVEVSIPSSLVILPEFPVETVVGTYLQAAVTMKTSNGSDFYRCDSFHSSVQWLVLSGNDSFKVVETTNEAIGYTSPVSPCAWTRLYASNPGRAMVHVTLVKEFPSSDDLLNKPVFLKKSFVVAAYPPLVAYQAGNGNQFGGYWINEQKPETVDQLFLAPGSEIDVVVRGGPEPWDQGIEFIEKVEILSENHMLQDGLIVSQAIASHGRLYRVACQTLGSFKLVFSRGNLVGDGHTLPAVANVKMSLICSFPSSISLIANEPENRPNVIHSFIQAERGLGRVRISPVSVANSCIIRLSAVAIHSSGNAFANSSSLCLLWELSGCEQLADWEVTLILGRSKCTWERFLALRNATGLCMVRAMVIGFSDTSHSYPKEISVLFENMKKDLTDGLTLQLVSSLRIIPSSVLLFFSPYAKANLSIVGGTCLLESTVNDTNVVDVAKPLGSGRCSSLVVYPKGIGVALVTVIDIGLTPPSTASATVQVADLDWIKIVSEEVIYLMVGTTQSFELSAGVDDGRVFDSSQYVYMDIRLNVEDDVLELAADGNISSIETNKICGSKFSLRATELGITILHVTARRQSGREILSQRIKVEVYAPLTIHPDHMFLAPGSSYTLTVRGGPASEVVLEYASMNDSTATIDPSSGRLSAVSEGNTTITATVYGHGGQVTCLAYVRVRVGIPSDMVLILQSEKLGVGLDMKIFVSSAEGNVFSFFELCKDYKWIIHDDQVLGFQRKGTSKYDAKFSDAAETDFLGHSDSQNLGFMSIVYGRSAGRTSVSVTFACEFSSSISRSQSISYNASGSLLVIPDPPLALGIPLTWVLPPFYSTSELLPFSSESHGEWDSWSRKGSIAYSVMKICGKSDDLLQSAVAIDGARIQTKESNNLACIQAKDRISGRAEIAACVRVAKVDHVRITANNHFTYAAEVAVGDRFELLISFHDALGIPFHEAYGVVPLDIDTNNHDVVSIEGTKDKDKTYDSSGKVYLQANRHGRALIRISMHSNPSKADYIMISVGAHMYPQNPVLGVGDHLNFTVSGEGRGALGSWRWLSANDSVISVDMQSGKSRAVSEGSTEVFVEGLGLKLQTKVTVLKVTSILVSPPVETLTNVPSPSKGYNFSVTFSDSYSHEFGAGNRGEILFDCMVDPSFVGYVKPWNDLTTGNTYCLFSPYSPEQLVHSTPKLKGELSSFKSSFHEALIYITVSASLREAPQVKGAAQALFVGGFLVIQENKCHLTPNKNKCLIVVIGNTDVAFHWNAKDQLLVNLLGRDDSGIGGRAEYEVKVLDGKSFADKVAIFLPLTGQKVEIDVYFEAGERKDPWTESTFNWTAALWTLLVLIICGFIFICLQRKPNLRRRFVPSVPANVAPTTPGHSPSSNGQLTPRTPQPYIEYVRRTIDDTPYYRRTGRRFDLQNTY